MELVQAQAEALGRTGRRLDECFHRLTELEATIRDSEAGDGTTAQLDEMMIDEFNQLRREAKILLRNLLIHREALGFRRHRTVEELYRLPDGKKRT
jgi:hypothetical protein